MKKSQACYLYLHFAKLDRFENNYLKLLISLLKHGISTEMGINQQKRFNTPTHMYPEYLSTSMNFHQFARPHCTAPVKFLCSSFHNGTKSLYEVVS